jgi:hypothetical protein
MHSNSIYWDIDEDMVYMNVRHLDCVVAVNYLTGQTEWVLGRYTGAGPALTLYNQDGQQVDTLFYHAHACEKIGPDRFIIYDNDFWNLTRPDPRVGITRSVEFIVDESASTATEVWSWTSPPSYYTRAQGDSNRLPNGNTLALHNLAPQPIMVEVNQQGEIVWEWTFNLTANDVGWRLAPNGGERFLEEPLLELESTTYTVSEGGMTNISFSAWDIFQRRHTADVTVRVFEGITLLAEENLEFLPHWQETQLSVIVPALVPGTHNVTLELENREGVTTQTTLLITVTTITPILLGAAAITVVVIVLIVITQLWKKRTP